MIDAAQTAPSGYGIYIHAPWCRARCPYCAFNVAVDPDPPVHAWSQGIRSAWASVAGAFQGNAASLYFGGGTPSLLDPSVVEVLIEHLPVTDQTEITLEANPGTVTPDQLHALAHAGVNRISIGVQSFQPRIARRLGRGHSINQSQHLMRQVATLGFRSWSVDFIFAVPDQTMEELEQDLVAILSHRPPHVSVYGLTIEENTPFADAQRAGRLSLPTGEQWRAMYDHIVAVLQDNGWSRYEVSNFALPGHESRHNEDISRGGAYAGLGPGAHGFSPSGERTTSIAPIAQWLEDPLPRATRPGPHEAAVDLVLTSLPHRDGVNLADMAARTRHTIDSVVIRTLVDADLLTAGSGTVRLANAGFPVADGVIRRLCDNLTPLTNPPGG